MIEKCVCGHEKTAHIYHEGACRTGTVVCHCAAFTTPNPPDQGATPPMTSELRPCWNCGVSDQKIVGPVDDQCGMPEHRYYMISCPCGEGYAHCGTVEEVREEWNGYACWKLLESSQKDLQGARRLLGTERDAFGKRETDLMAELAAAKQGIEKARHEMKRGYIDELNRLTREKEEALSLERQHRKEAEERVSMLMATLESISRGRGGCEQKYCADVAEEALVHPSPTQQQEKGW